MVSTRHHPREFPEPELSPSQSPTSTKSSLKASSPNGSSRSPSKLTPTRKLTFEMSTSSPLPFAEPLTPRPGLHNPPPLLILWLVVSLPLVIWDTLYVFLRPHSMEGGIFHSPIWTPYKLYATVDYTYGWPAWDGGVGFTAAQASLNALETAGYVWYFWRVARGLQGVGKEGGGTGGRFAALLKGTHGGSRECAGAVTVGFATSVMTVSKTILYWLNEYFSNFSNIRHNTPWDVFWLWIVPNGAWLVLPSYMIWVFGRDIIAGLKRVEKKME